MQNHLSGIGVPTLPNTNILSDTRFFHIVKQAEDAGRSEEEAGIPPSFVPLQALIRFEAAASEIAEQRQVHAKWSGMILEKMYQFMKTGTNIRTHIQLHRKFIIFL